MKLIIDIPEWKYKSICEGIEASKRCGVVGIDPDIHEAIYKGIPYEERPKGEWKHIIEEDNDVECPFCGFQEDGIYYNFCPRCGADMRWC